MKKMFCFIAIAMFAMAWAFAKESQNFSLHQHCSHYCPDCNTDMEQEAACFGHLSVTENVINEPNMNTGTDRYCTKCNVELINASRSKYKPSKEQCTHCKGTGSVRSYNGNITCSYCDGSGKKLKLVTEYFLRCPKCNAEYSK